MKSLRALKSAYKLGGDATVPAGVGLHDWRCADACAVGLPGACPAGGVGAPMYAAAQLAWREARGAFGQLFM